MKNLKELNAILTALYCINFKGSKDTDIDKIIKYAFSRLLDSNTNLLTLACVSREKKEVLEEVRQILEDETTFYKWCAEK